MSELLPFESIKADILSFLENGLAKDLYYHNLEHTLDVTEQAARIANEASGITEEGFLLLQIACLYHDSGFVFTWHDHEEAGVELARKRLPLFGADASQLDIIEELIMSTQIPQRPNDVLGKVICDADLDYLGRDDFFPISDSLYQEMKVRNMISSQEAWDQVQIKFFHQHRYFTESNRRLRAAAKEQHLQQILVRSMSVGRRL